MFVLKTTGSVVQMGLAGAVVGIGTLLSSVTGGPLVDRFGFRRASILSDVTAGAAVAAVPLLFWADALPFWLLLTLALVISILNAPGDLARRALVPTLADWAAMPLERANARHRDPQVRAVGRPHHWWSPGGGCGRCQRPASGRRNLSSVGGCGDDLCPIAHRGQTEYAETQRTRPPGLR